MKPHLIAVLALFIAICRTQAAVLYVSPAGSHLEPYDTWGKAANDIQSAVDLAEPGDSVLVGDGQYTASEGTIPPYHDLSTPNVVVITDQIAVSSVNGPGATHIIGQASTNGQDGMRCVFMTAGSLTGFTLTNGHTLAHTTVRSGGGAYLHGGGLIRDCVITGNTAEEYGGGVYCVSGGELANCTIVSNRAVDYGGGAYTIDGGRLADCEIVDNLSTSGGGVASYTGGLMERCLIASNRADIGGGVFVDYEAEVVDCNILANSANDVGGGVFAGGGLIVNCTIAGNAATNSGGGVHCEVRGGGSNRTGNCIIYFNCAETNSDWCLATGVAQVDHSCLTSTNGSGIGPGCVTNDPQLVDLPGLDVHLTADSPCIDRGTNFAWNGSRTDIDGQIRVFNGLPDMGADEAAIVGVGISCVGGGVQTVWETVVNARCCLQRCEKLTDANWVDVGSEVTISGANGEFADTENGPTSAFYRLVWLRD